MTDDPGIRTPGFILSRAAAASSWAAQRLRHPEPRSGCVILSRAAAKDPSGATI